MRAADAPSVFQQGMLRIARATTVAEKKWLSEALAELDG